MPSLSYQPHCTMRAPNFKLMCCKMREGWRGGSNEGWRGRSAFTSQTVFSKSFCISRFPHKFVNLSFIISNEENKLVLELTLANNFMRELTFAKQHKHCLGDKREGEA